LKPLAKSPAPLSVVIKASTICVIAKSIRFAEVSCAFNAFPIFLYLEVWVSSSPF
jgi:hypothetical protein